MKNEWLTAKEFEQTAKEQGIEVSYKTLRLYIDLGLLPKPEKKGKNVGFYHVSGIKTIRILKNLMQHHNVKLKVLKQFKQKGIEVDSLLELFNKNPNNKQNILAFLQAGLDLNQCNMLIRFTDGLQLHDIKKLSSQFPQRKFNIFFLKIELDKLIVLEEKSSLEKIAFLRQLWEKLDGIEKSLGK